MGKYKGQKKKQQNRKSNKTSDTMNNSSKKIIANKVVTGLLVIIMVVAAAFGLWKLSGEDDKPSEKLVFTVGTEEVYLDEIHLCILQNMMNLNITADDMQNTTAEDGSNAADYYKREILELIMDYKVEYMVAKEQGLVLTEEEKKAVRSDVVTYMGQVDARLLNHWGIEQEMVEEVYTQRYLAHKLEKAITENVEVEEQQYCTIYLMLFPKIEMSEDGDYVRQKDGETPVMLSDEKVQQNKENAENALAELKNGAAAQEIAQKYGVESVSGEESNLKESFEEPFLQYTTTLKEGECSPVIETEGYFAIVQMISENNEEFAQQILKYYKEDLEEEAVEQCKVEWYEQMGITEEPVFAGNTWEKISLYDFVQ